MLAHDIRQIPRTQDVQISHNITFDSMLLAFETLQGLTSAGFLKPSPIQLHGIPLGKCGFDLLLEAKSGTGKTAVFTVIALEKLDLRKGLQVVVLAPTREIAAQICDVIKLIGSEYKGLQVEVVMGGLSVHEDIEKFKRNVHIVVASPGRLLHLIKDKHIDTSCVRLLVLDEADKLVEKSFQEDVKQIISYLPTQKQVIMSSATYTETAKTFIMSFMQNAQHICPDSNCVLLGVDQKISIVKYNSNIVKQTQHRFQEVLKIFSRMQFKQCLLFCNYQARVSEIHKLLLRAKWPAEQLYGNQEQTERLVALKTLQEYKCRILIATDLAARGIDASNIDLVINFEPPHEWQTYLHRIGRAGRYGSYGTAITILSEGAETKKFHAILEPMKETLNITDLWCNNEISQNGDVALVQDTLPNEKKSEVMYKNEKVMQEFQELWKSLTFEDTADESDFESFDELCQLFDDSSTDIKSFDELLHSFEDHQFHVEKDLKFKHININAEQYKNIRDSLNKYLNFLSQVSLQINNEEIMTNNTTNSNCCQSVNTADLGNKAENNKMNKCDDHSSIDDVNNYNHNMTCINTSKIINRNADTKSQTIQSSIQNNIYKNENRINHTSANNYQNICVRKSIVENKKTADNCLYSTERALREAGLPTAFGKPNSNKCKQFYTKQNEAVQYKYKFSKKQHASKFDQDDVQSDVSSTSKSSNNSKAQSLYFNNNVNIFYRQGHKNNIQKTKNKMDTNCDAPKPRIELRSEHYAKWYKQLKLQTKQIELAIYINELSKLSNL